ncbi:ABC transporter ATP-binding protein [Paenibacillus sp. L3-i20]|uniref:ABC transporter ATP-binding protein n=1 Tax=Paenibacillus sp. L3-i20 TaxID=2905833 RepID=UPI001EDDAF67|nr:ABC transporter ATP-binding protein [Paenibacillus sp. L3-i20]GKU79470.1 bacitracin ABC transporter ATP-binding protein [Paenibacillus sp. L3-i20]
MNGPVLSVRGLHKKIRGITIVENINFDISAGEIFGFLGPNGAGKTTTIRMLVDLIKPTSGHVLICGYDVKKQPEQALRHVGCIVENPEVYSYLTGWQNLEQFARMLDGVHADRIQEVTSIVKLNDRIHDKVKTYSLGMRQRLGIAQALLGHPKLLILDEPTNGLDPKGIKELRAFVHQLASEGLSLLISSHLLSEIQMLCGKVVIIDKGKIIAAGKVEELMEQAKGYIKWKLAPHEDGKKVLQQDPSVVVLDNDDLNQSESASHSSEQEEIITTIMRDDHIPSTVDRLVGQGIGIKAVYQAEPTLEDLFLTLTEGESFE